MKAIVNNRVILSEEAVFDYEHCLGKRKRPSWAELLLEAKGDSQKAWELAEPYEQPLRKLDKRTLKSDIREYINLQQQSGRLLYKRYFRCKWHDEYTDRTLMIFLYRVKKRDTLTERWWRIAGICDAREWNEELEEDGEIRRWLKPFEHDMPKGDWVADQQARAEADKLVGENIQASLQYLPKEIRNAIMHGTSKDLTEAISFFENASQERFSR